MIKVLVYDLEYVAELSIADSFIKRFFGYMFRKEPHHEAILIKPCNSIHTFFMNFPIDVLFLNEDMEVVLKIDGLKPGRVIMPQKEAKFVIEGKVGIFKDIRVGKKLLVLE